MARRARRRGPDRRPTVRERLVRFVRQLFGGGSSLPPENLSWEGPEGGVGVREPRRPRPPTRSGAVALEPPPEETRDIRAVGE
jgi:hypothetical protein